MNKKYLVVVILFLVISVAFALLLHRGVLDLMGLSTPHWIQGDVTPFLVIAVGSGVVTAMSITVTAVFAVKLIKLRNEY